MTDLTRKDFVRNSVAIVAAIALPSNFFGRARNAALAEAEVSEATVYCGLYTKAGEVTGSSYARMPFVTFPTAIGQAANVTFPCATEDWGEIEGWALLNRTGQALFKGMNTHGWAPLVQQADQVTVSFVISEEVV